LKPPLAFGGWELGLQTPVLQLPRACYCSALSSTFTTQRVLLLSIKQQLFCFCT